MKRQDLKKFDRDFIRLHISKQEDYDHFKANLEEIKNNIQPLSELKSVHQMLTGEQLQLLKSKEAAEQDYNKVHDFKALQLRFWMSLSEIQKHWIQAQINAQNLFQIYYQHIYDRVMLVGRDLGYS